MGLSERLFGPGHDLHARQVDTSGSLLQAGGAMAGNVTHASIAASALLNPLLGGF